MKNNLLFRVITAVVAVPLIVALLFAAPWWGFGILAGVAMAIASLELFQMSHPGDRVAQLFGLLLCSGVYITLLETNFGASNSFIAMCAVLAVTPLALLFTLFRPGEQRTALQRMATLAMGPLYTGVSLAAIASLRRMEPGGSSRIGAGLVVLTLMIAWLSDTFGYFFGKGLKGPKVYPSVSPNKTWSGSIGGLLGSALGAVIAHFLFLPELPLAKGLLIAVLAGAVGQAGDFCESLIKRSTGVKDSGGILPGHGGILDRIDAMMFVAMALYVAVRSGWLLDL